MLNTRILKKFENHLDKIKTIYYNVPTLRTVYTDKGLYSTNQVGTLIFQCSKKKKKSLAYKPCK